MTKRYGVVALDIGNTCVQLCPDRVSAVLQGVDISPEFFIRGYDPHFCAFLKGEIEEQEYLELLVKEYPGKVTVQLARQALWALIGDAVPGMPELIRELHDAGSRIAFFSDMNSLHYAAFRAGTVGQFDYLQEGIFSNEVHLLKPELRMFQLFEERFGYPDLYLDDREDLIAAAKAHGWNAVQITGDTAALRKAIL